jgi:type II secretory pathway component PulJ
MDAQDNKFNYKIILAALVAVIIGILIAFYYSYAQSNTQISFLEQEKELLVKDLTLMKADVDRLTALNEVNEIEIQGARYEVQQLLDSVGRLTFTIQKLREFKTELRRLESKNDSLKLKNNFLRYNNMLLADKNAETQSQLEELRKASSSIAEAEALQRQRILELNKELKTKSYLKLEGAEGTSYRIRGDRPIRTNKASTIEKLRGCVTIMADPTMINKVKVLYFQFLGPNMGVIEDNANTITVQGNVYSKKAEIVFMGEETQLCDFITIPEGSLKSGNYTVNIFEDQRLLASAEFQLK